LSAQLQGADAACRRAKDAIRRAKGDLDRAESLHSATHLDYSRLKEASGARPGLIAEQDLDNALAQDKEGEAQISADEAALSEAQSQFDVAVATTAITRQATVIRYGLRIANRDRLRAETCTVTVWSRRIIGTTDSGTGKVNWNKSVSATLTTGSPCVLEPQSCPRPGGDTVQTGFELHR
jgi:hypothetical protein